MLYGNDVIWAANSGTKPASLLVWNVVMTVPPSTHGATAVRLG